MVAIWLVYALWLMLVAYLTVSAIGTKRDTQPHLGQSLLLTLALIAAFVLPHVPLFAIVNFAPTPPPISAIGIVLTVAGMTILITARQHLGRNWSQTVSAKEDHELVTSGPYHYVRHPMYAGGILAALGSAMVVGGPFVFLLAVLTPLFLWRVRAEDALMTRQSPRAYPAYKQRTKALIPWVF